MASRATAKRKAQALRHRLRIGEESGWRCVYCGCRLWPHTLTLDHILARRWGGKHAPDNKLAAYDPCNRAKGSGGTMRFVPAACATTYSARQ